MKAMVAILGLLLPLGLAGWTSQSPEALAANDAQQFLAAHFQLGANDFRELDRRRAVTRTLNASDGREVAILGLVRIAAPATFYLDQLRDIVAFKKAGAAVLQIGAFSNPARLEDVAGLSLEESDFDSLRRC